MNDKPTVALQSQLNLSTAESLLGVQSRLTLGSGDWTLISTGARAFSGARGREGMNADQSLFYLGEMLWTVLLIAGPLLIATLVVGLLISVFQVTTQIQEITLSYVPKILMTGLLLMLMGPWFLRQLTSFTRTLYGLIPTLGA